MTLQLHTLNGNSEAWDDFVNQNSEGTFFHLSGWQKILADIGHKCFYLYATENEKIVGVMPLAQVKSWLFGNALVSTPFCVYGGALGQPEVKRFLEKEAIFLGQKLNVDHVEFRYRDAQVNNLVTHSQHAYFSCELAEDSAQILAGIKKKQRAVIRHALNEQFDATFDETINDFYNTYSQSVRNLGTPVFSKQFFQRIQEVFPDNCEILTIRKNEQPFSSVLSFYYKHEVLPYYGGGILEAKNVKSNDFMYYQLMCHAKEDRHCQQYDFGRSKIDSGAYQYKKHWGMTATPLHYQYQLINAKSLPNLSPNNPKYQIFIKLWQKLPLSVSQWLGPYLSRYLG